MKKLLLVGAGGHCRSVIDSLDSGQYQDIGLIDDTSDKCQNLPYRFLGSDADIPELFADGYSLAAITLGSVGDPSIRIKLYKKYKEIGFEFPVIIDPSAIISKHVTIKEGVYIGKGAIVNTGASLGICSIINSGAVIEHDCTIGDFVHIAPNASLSGGVSVGNYSHIGIGSTIIQSINIGENTIIGAGAVVINDISSNCTAVGVPAKTIKRGSV